MSKPRYTYFLAAVTFLIAGPALLAQKMDTVPSTDASSIALSRYYFKSPADEKTERTQLDSAITRLAVLKGRLNSGSQLLAALEANDQVQELVYKHFAYLRLLCSKDRKAPACSDANEIAAAAATKTSFLQSELLAIPPDRFLKFETEMPELRKYAFAIESVRTAAGHLLNSDRQRMVDLLSPALTDWESSLYSDTVAGIEFGTVQTANRPIDVSRQRNLIAASTDSRVREEGFRKRFAGYASRRDVLAIALIRTGAAQTALAHVYSYPNAPDRKYETLGFVPERSRDLLKRMAEKAALVQRYQKIRARDIEREYNTRAGPWDMSAPNPTLVVPHYSLSQARTIFHEAFAVLGPEYQREFDSLVAADSGRADIVPGGAANRYNGGYSVGFPGTTSALFIGRYDGTFKDLSVIAHEGGHAAHRALMSHNGVLPDYANGPGFLFESFAAFNELLLADYMANQTEDPALRHYYHEQWLNIKGLDAFYGAQDALLEQAVCDGVAAGTVKSADDLDRLTEEVDRHFSIFTNTVPELRTRWATVSLAYEDPLYSVNYVYGGLLALKYFQLWHTQPEQFVPRYLSLLRNGFTASPAVLLRRYLNIDMDDPHLLDDDVALIETRLQQLETEIQQETGHPLGETRERRPVLSSNQK